MFTVDLEPDWGLAGTRGVREILPRLLELLDAREIPATFFVTGLLAETCRDDLLRIGPRHEIASHGFTHRRFDALSREEVREELHRSRAALEGLGREVTGVRAPFFATPPTWLDEAAAAGYRYDASAGSVRPSFRNRRWPEAGGLLPRLGVSVFRDGLTPFCLTYLRLYHPFGLRWMPRQPRLFYLHLHEFLPAAAASGLCSRI